MLLMRASQILVSPGVRRLAALPVAILLLGACGQKGPLFLPASDAGRATLTQTLTSPAPPASAPPVTGTASPVRTP
jgi:predicted small lipoprotein YifL